MPEELSCPECAAALATIEVEGLKLDRCPACGGVWFDFEEVDAILRRDVQDSLWEAGAPEHEAPADADDRKYLPCPKCAGEMIKVKPPQRPDIAVDTCMVCYGRWLRSADAAKLHGEGLLDRVKELIHKLIPHK